MFVDKVEFTVSSGKGGAGCTSFRKEKFVVKGGPDGGDGGKGGDVIFIVDDNTDTLSWFKGRKILSADNGKQGMGSRMSGKSAKPLYLRVPRGTQVIDPDTKDILLDMTELGKEYLLLKGGKGGLGNYHFKSSRNQTPRYSQPGLKGQEKVIRLELNLIADVGLVGFPNVGKSTLVSSISNARPQIADYEFTTLIPNLGVVNIGEYSSFVMADIPGIIDGASRGKGLGLEFLKHIQRTKTLLYMVDLSNYRTPIQQYNILKKEVESFSPLLAKKNYAIALTKIDTLTYDKLNDIVKEFAKELKIDISNENYFDFDDDKSYFVQETTLSKFDSSKPYFILPISSVVQTNIKPLKFALYDLISKI